YPVRSRPRRYTDYTAVLRGHHDLSRGDQLDRVIEGQACPARELLLESAGLEPEARGLLVHLDPGLALGCRCRPDRLEDGVGRPEQRRRPGPVAAGGRNAGCRLEALGDRPGLAQAPDDLKAP